MGEGEIVEVWEFRERSLGLVIGFIFFGIFFSSFWGLSKIWAYSGVVGL